MIDPRELQNLYDLLDDPEVSVHDAVVNRLVSLGEDVIGPLTRLDGQHGGENSDRIETISHTIRRERARERIDALLEGGNPDINLEDALFTIAKYGYPALDVASTVRLVDDMATEILDMQGKGTTLFHNLRMFLFGNLGFSGNRESYYDPDNSYINRVIDERKGIPVTLSALVLLVAQRLGLPLVGIGMPMHFLVTAENPDSGLFLDAYNRGILITREQCRQMISRGGFRFEETMLAPVSNRYILERILRNLLFAYQQKQDPEEVRNITALLIHLNPSYAADFEDANGGDEEE